MLADRSHPFNRPLKRQPGSRLCRRPAARDGGCRLTEEDAQQPSEDGQADALALTDTGELGLLVGIDNDTQVLPLAELPLGISETALTVEEVLPQVLEWLFSGVALDFVEGVVGLAVEGLTRNAAETSLL